MRHPGHFHFGCMGATWTKEANGHLRTEDEIWTFLNVRILGTRLVETCCTLWSNWRYFKYPLEFYWKPEWKRRQYDNIKYAIMGTKTLLKVLLSRGRQKSTGAKMHSTSSWRVKESTDGRVCCTPNSQQSSRQQNWSEQANTRRRSEVNERRRRRV